MIHVRRLGPQIGAEITGVDVRTLDDADFEIIYRAWLDYNVVVVRDQDLTLPEYVRYSRRFGSLELHPSKSTRHPEAPEVTFLGVNKFDADGKLNMRIYRRGAEGWHTDGSYEQVPFKATQLYAVAIPSRGGDTYFASCYASYAALPDTLKQSSACKTCAVRTSTALASRKVKRCSIRRTAMRRRRCIRCSGRIRKPGARRCISIPTSCCTSKVSRPKRARA
jgi:taurine dioxygenase